MKLKHEMKTYPPRVKMTVILADASDYVKIPVKFDGCSNDDQLSLDLMFPLGIIIYILYYCMTGWVLEGCSIGLTEKRDNSEPDS